MPSSQRTFRSAQRTGRRNWTFEVATIKEKFRLRRICTLLPNLSSTSWRRTLAMTTTQRYHGRSCSVFSAGAHEATQTSAMLHPLLCFCPHSKVLTCHHLGSTSVPSESAAPRERMGVCPHTPWLRKACSMLPKCSRERRAKCSARPRASLLECDCLCVVYKGFLVVVAEYTVCCLVSACVLDT